MDSRLKVIIVHGTGGSPDGNWFPWLKDQLEACGIDGACPRFPTPEGQTFEAWSAIFQETVDRQEEDIILVGHSIGAPFVMRMAEQTQRPYRALFAICPFAKTLGLKGYDRLNATFVDHAFDWSRIKAGARFRRCFAGEADPYVPPSYSTEVAQAMDAELVTIPHGGHLNAEFGYTRFPQVLEDICAHWLDSF